MRTEKKRLSWPGILDLAREIVDTYETRVTLRQLFYRLVSAGAIPNTQSAYTTLSSRTAEARRQHLFPTLMDQTRTIERNLSFEGVEDATQWLRTVYRRDRTEGQGYSVYLGVEKAGMLALLDSWFGNLGVPILALRGYSSQSFVDEVREDVASYRRPAVLLYAGDYDPSGEDILRDFKDRTHCFHEVVRVALDREQVRAYDLPPMPGKATDTRARRFIEAEGDLVQVELDALSPDTLRDLYQQAIDPFFDVSTYREVLLREAAERAQLRLN